MPSYLRLVPIVIHFREHGTDNHESSPLGMSADASQGPRPSKVCTQLVRQRTFIRAFFATSNSKSSRKLRGRNFQKFIVHVSFKVA